MIWLVFLKTEFLPCVVSIIYEFKIRDWSLMGSPSSCLISFSTSLRACALLTGMNRSWQSTSWRLRTMYLCLIEADMVGFEMLSRPLLPELESSTVERRCLAKPFGDFLLFDAYLEYSISYCFSAARPAKGSSSWANFSTASENLTTSSASVLLPWSYVSFPKNASLAAFSSGNLTLTSFCLLSATRARSPSYSSTRS